MRPHVSMLTSCRHVNISPCLWLQLITEIPVGIWGPVQTPYFTWAESNANEGEQRILLICIRFGSCEVRRLNLAWIRDKFKLKIDLSVKTPWQEYGVVAGSSRWAPVVSYFDTFYLTIRSRDNHPASTKRLLRLLDECRITSCSLAQISVDFVRVRTLLVCWISSWSRNSSSLSSRTSWLCL